MHILFQSQLYTEPLLLQNEDMISYASVKGIQRIGLEVNHLVKFHSTFFVLLPLLLVEKE